MNHYRATPEGNVPLTDEEELEFEARQRAVVEPAVPQIITALQGLLALDRVGMSAAYEAWANSPSRTFAERAFINRTINWRWDDAVLNAGCSELGITEDQKKQLFILAASL